MIFLKSAETLSPEDASDGMHGPQTKILVLLEQRVPAEQNMIKLILKAKNIPFMHYFMIYHDTESPFFENTPNAVPKDGIQRLSRKLADHTPSRGAFRIA
jgi:hypothetical protein